MNSIQRCVDANTNKIDQIHILSLYMQCINPRALSTSERDPRKFNGLFCIAIVKYSAEFFRPQQLCNSLLLVFVPPVRLPFALYPLKTALKPNYSYSLWNNEVRCDSMSFSHAFWWFFDVRAMNVKKQNV